MPASTTLSAGKREQKSDEAEESVANCGASEQESGSSFCWLSGSSWLFSVKLFTSCSASSNKPCAGKFIFMDPLFGTGTTISIFALPLFAASTHTVACAVCWPGLTIIRQLHFSFRSQSVSHLFGFHPHTICVKQCVMTSNLLAR